MSFELGGGCGHGCGWCGQLDDLLAKLIQQICFSVRAIEVTGIDGRGAELDADTSLRIDVQESRLARLDLVRTPNAKCVDRSLGPEGHPGDARLELGQLISAVSSREDHEASTGFEYGYALVGSTSIAILPVDRNVSQSVENPA